MEFIRLSSRQNPLIKRLSSFSDKKHRDAENVIVVEGETLLAETLEKGIFPEEIIIREDADALKTERIKKIAENCENLKIISVTAQVFEKITTEKSSDGFVSVFSRNCLPRFKFADPDSKFCALEFVQDPGNVGTIIRSALAFGMKAVILSGCADPFSQKAVRASMGAVFSMPVITFGTTDEMFEFFNENGIETVAATLEEDSVDIREVPLSGKVAVIIGNEGNGLSEKAVKASKRKSIIPISGAESLNAAGAAAIFMWEMKRRAN